MLFRKFCCVIAAFLPAKAFCQSLSSFSAPIYRNEISLVSDNDNYTLLGRDGYYTNGFFLKFSQAVDPSRLAMWKQHTGIRKIVNAFELGQAIYNPVSYNRPFPENQDRPFAAYLSASFDQQLFFEKPVHRNSMWSWGAAIGAIGPDSYGEEVQRWYHNVIGIYDVKGWPYQVNNEWSLNLKGAWYTSLFEGKALREAADRGIDMHGFVKVNAGNALTNASTGFLLRLGKLENLYNSSHFRARIGTAISKPLQHTHELYLFYEPALCLQGYNAVLQGGMLHKNKGPLTVSLQRFVFSQQLGVRFAKKRFSGALVYTNRTKEATGQIRNENFGSLQFGYRFSAVGGRK